MKALISCSLLVLVVLYLDTPTEAAANCSGSNANACGIIPAKKRTNENENDQAEKRSHANENDQSEFEERRGLSARTSPEEQKQVKSYFDEMADGGNRVADWSPGRKKPNRRLVDVISPGVASE